MSSAKLKKIYLAGPIFGCSQDEAQGWRSWVSDQLPGQVIDPTRLALDPEQPERVVIEDKLAISQSVCLLVNLWKVSAGTSIEIYYAWSEMKPVIVVANRWQISPWIVYHSTKIVETLTDGVAEVRKYLASAELT